MASKRAASSSSDGDDDAAQPTPRPQAFLWVQSPNSNVYCLQADVLRTKAPNSYFTDLLKRADGRAPDTPVFLSMPSWFIEGVANFAQDMSTRHVWFGSHTTEEVAEVLKHIDWTPLLDLPIHSRYLTQTKMPCSVSAPAAKETGKQATRFANIIVKFLTKNMTMAKLRLNLALPEAPDIVYAAQCDALRAHYDFHSTVVLHAKTQGRQEHQGAFVKELLPGAPPLYIRTATREIDYKHRFGVVITLSEPTQSDEPPLPTSTREQIFTHAQ